MSKEAGMVTLKTVKNMRQGQQHWNFEIHEASFRRASLAVSEPPKYIRLQIP